MDNLTLEEIQGIKDRCRFSNTGKFDNDVTMYRCPVCEKDFVISDSTQWVYKRRTRARRKNEAVLYLCSYSCSRTYDQIFDHN